MFGRRCSWRRRELKSTEAVPFRSRLTGLLHGVRPWLFGCLFSQMLKAFPGFDAKPCCQLPPCVSSIDLPFSRFRKVVLCTDNENDGFFRDGSQFVNPVAHVLETLQIRDIV